MARRGIDLTTGSLGKHMTRLTIPMIGGMFAMTAFNITDTYFISRLGTIHLAAMSFTFPVVMIIGAIAMSIGIGASSVISRAIGRGDHDQVTRVTTDTLILAILVVGFFSVVGILTINPLFRAMGADENTLGLVREYMLIWYSAVAVLIIPMIGNFAIRSTGDTLTPALIMVAVFGLNIILDPIMIFGFWKIPAMGLKGAAWATVIARAFSMFGALYVLHFKYRLINIRQITLAGLFKSWGQVIHVALPTAATQLLRPLTLGAITRLAATFGEPVVAAYGAGTRIELFSIMIPIAFGSTLLPLIGQNWGAGKYDRVTRTRFVANRFGILTGIISVAVLWPLAPLLAGLFSNDPRVVPHLITFVRIVPIGSGMLNICIYIGMSLNAIGKPVDSALLSVIRAFVFVIPFAWIGAYFFGVSGMFTGLAAGPVAGGILALSWGNRIYSKALAERSVSRD